MMTQLFPQRTDYRLILLDFRATLFRHLTTIMAIFGFVVANVLLFLDPVPFHLFFVAIAFSAFTVFLRLKAESFPNITRYVFVIVLYLTLFVSMLLFPMPWVATLYFPVVLIGALLMTNANIFGSLLFLVLMITLDTSGYVDYPLPIVIFSVGLMVAVTSTIVSTFNVALQWYSSMHHHADKLLQETRERRSELVATVKSLETAYNTQRRLKQQLIFARKQAEEARRMKERFASNISHELRTPLNIILGFSEILYLTPEVYGDVIFPPKLHRDVAQIYRSSRHLLELIDDVLDLSHIELSQFSLNFESTSMTGFLVDTADMVSNLFRDKSVSLMIDIAPHLPNLDIDRTRMRQVIINLITNAHRFTSEGSVQLRAYVDYPHLHIDIEDTGVGIAPDKLGLIFEEFFQVDYSLSRKHGGAGLGLSITKRFVEAHGGSIRVESCYQQGSKFTVCLPLPEQSPLYLNQSIATLSNESPLPPVILVVDPDIRVGQLVERILHDYEIVQVAEFVALKEAIHQYSPHAIIYNQLTERELPANIHDLGVLTIVCSLPSAFWITQDLQVASLLVKPFDMHQLMKQIEQFPEARNILIIDDDMGFVQLVQRSLEVLPEQYNIQRAYDGKQALGMIEATPPDLLIMDLNMPELNGWQLIRHLNSDPELCDIPVIVLTATGYTDTQSLSDIYVLNNSTIGDTGVLRMIEKILNSKRPE